MKLMRFGGLLIVALTVAACSDTEQGLIVDGARGPYFETDLAECQQVALQRGNDNSNAAGGAIVGGLIGGVDASSGNTIDGMLAGAVVGGLIGSAEDSIETDKARERIVFNCMRGRGHNVVG